MVSSLRSTARSRRISRPSVTFSDALTVFTYDRDSSLRPPNLKLDTLVESDKNSGVQVEYSTSRESPPDLSLSQENREEYEFTNLSNIKDILEQIIQNHGITPDQGQELNTNCSYWVNVVHETDFETTVLSHTHINLWEKISGKANKVLGLNFTLVVSNNESVLDGFQKLEELAQRMNKIL